MTDQTRTPAVPVPIAFPSFTALLRGLRVPGVLLLAALAGTSAAGAQAVNFSSVPLGTEMLQPVTLTITTAGAVNAVNVLTMGATKDAQGNPLDFADGGGNCVGSEGSTCVEFVSFTPRYAGLRMGAVELTDSSGNVLTTTYVYGVGTGPQAAFPTGTASVLSTSGLSPSLNTPLGIAVDGAGNVYIADQENDRVVKVTAAGVASVLGTGSYALNQPSGVAVDGAGNIYIANSYRGSVVEVMPSGAASSLGTGSYTLAFPGGIAVDGAGDVYIVDTMSNDVLEVTAAGAASVLSTGSLSWPSGVAVDGAGNIYVADEQNNRVVRVASTGTASVLGTGSASLDLPWGVAVDGAGDVYIADTYHDRVVEMAAPGVPAALNFAAAAVGATSSDSPQSVRLENIGNTTLQVSSLAVSPTGQSTNSFTLASGTTCTDSTTLAAGESCLLEVDFAPQSVASLTGTITVTDNSLNAIAPYATQSIALNGTGYQITLSPATLAAATAGTAYGSVPFSASNGTAPYTFAIISGALPGGMSLSSAGVLSGTPASAGTYSFTVVATDTNNQTGSQNYSLTVNAAVTATQQIATETLTYNTAASFTPVTGSGGTAPFSYSITNGTLPSGLSIGSSTGMISGTPKVTSSATTYTVEVTDSNGFTATNTFSLTVSPATSSLAITAPTSGTYGGTGTATYGGNYSGTPTLSSTTTGVCTVSGSTVTYVAAGTCALTATTTAGNYTAGAATASFTVGQAALTITASPVTEPYGTLPPTGSVTSGFSSSGLKGTDAISSVTMATTDTATTAAGSSGVTVTPSAAVFSPGGASNYAITYASGAVTVKQATPTILISNIPAGAVYYGGSLTPTYSYSGNGTPTESVSSSTPAVCTVSGTTVSYIAAGTCTLIPSATATADYAAVTGSAQSFTIGPAALTITASSVTESYGTVPPTGSVTAGFTSSGLKGTDAVSSVTMATTDTATTAAGSSGVTVTPSAAVFSSGSASNYAINYASGAVTINPATNSLAITAPTSGIYGGTGTATYGGNYSGTPALASTTTSVCTVSGSTVTYIAAGTCGLSATTSAGNYTAGSATTSFTVSPAANSLAIIGPTSDTYGGTGTATYGGNYSGTPTLSSTTTSVCTVSGSTVTYVGVGTCSLSSATSGGNYTAGSATKSFSVSQASQTITVTTAAPLSAAYNSSFGVAATASSGLAVSIAGSNGCAGSGSGSATITMTSGTTACTVTFTQAGNTDYTTATTQTESTSATLAAQSTLSVTGVPATAQAYDSSFAVGTSGGSGTGTVAFIASGSCSVSGSMVTMSSGTGSCSVYATKAADSDYSNKTSATVTVNAALAAPTVTLASSAAGVIYENSITLTATVSSAAGAPSGTVTFLDGTTPLGTGTLSGGVATFRTAALAAGSHSLTAAYGGDTNFAATASSALTESVIDVTVGSPTGVGSNGSSATVIPGNAAVISVPIAPSSGTSFPAALTLTLTGLPAGATATVAPSAWSQTASTTWTLPAGTALSGNTLVTVQVPAISAAMHTEDSGWPRRGTPLAIGLLLLPFARRMRRGRKGISRICSFALLLVFGLGSAAALAGLTGCGGGFFAQLPKTSTTTVAVTSGALTRTTTFTVTVE